MAEEGPDCEEDTRARRLKERVDDAKHRAGAWWSLKSGAERRLIVLGSSASAVLFTLGVLVDRYPTWKEKQPFLASIPKDLFTKVLIGTAAVVVIANLRRVVVAWPAQLATLPRLRAGCVTLFTVTQSSLGLPPHGVVNLLDIGKKLERSAAYVLGAAKALESSSAAQVRRDWEENMGFPLSALNVPMELNPDLEPATIRTRDALNTLIPLLSPQTGEEASETILRLERFPAEVDQLRKHVGTYVTTAPDSDEGLANLHHGFFQVGVTLHLLATVVFRAEFEARKGRAYPGQRWSG